MNSDLPLTAEEKLFAEKNHEIVYKFLRKHHLSEADFYDVVIFSYFRAVCRFCTIPELQQYSFNTIAWSAMKGALRSHYRSQNSQKHQAQVFSLNAPLHGDGLNLEEMIAAPDAFMQQLEINLLLHDLASRASRQQMNVVRLKSKGYTNSAIARQQKTSVSHVSKILNDIRKLLTEICYG